MSAWQRAHMDTLRDFFALGVGEHRTPCPQCGRSPRDKTFGVTVEPGRAVGHCFRCGHVELQRDESRRVRPGRIVQVTTKKRDTLSDYGRALWEACRPLDGAALAYLERRECAVPPRDSDLRFHPALKHPVTGTEHPAMVALVTDAITNAPMSLHRTFLTRGGEKANVEPVRMLLGGHRKAGGVIRLWPDEAVTYGLGVAEGIESGLSLAHAHTPVWACIDAGNLAAFPVLDGVESLVIAQDNDPAGVAAASECARRWRAAGKSAAIVADKREGADINDLARECAHGEG